MLITEVKSKHVKVAIYAKEPNRLIEYGWVELEGLEGWTLTKYDWESFIKRNNDE